MTIARENFETKFFKSNKLCLLLFLLLATKMTFASVVLPNDTIRIDGRIVVVEKEEVENLEEIPQKEFKEKINHTKYILNEYSWGISPYNVTTLSPTHHQINEFLDVKNKTSLSNFSLGIRYGIQLSHWFFESGVCYSSHSFRTPSFDVGELLDSTINQVENHTFEGFVEDNNQLYQYAFEYFMLGPEERVEQLNITQNKNRFTFIRIPLMVGRNFEVKKNIRLNVKTGIYNSFILSSSFSRQYLINSSKDFITVDNLTFKKYLPELAFETGLSFELPSKNNYLYTGIYGVMPLKTLNIDNNFLAVSSGSFGLKIGIIVNLF